jgi:RND family efflux transporter MFP subunit
MDDTRHRDAAPAAETAPGPSSAPAEAAPQTPRRRLLPVALTLAAVAVALPLGWAMWQAYMEAPWTRDGTVRAYVVTVAPEVEGRIVALPLVDNQFVRKDDLLMVVDPTDYRIAVALAQAAVQQTQANAENAAREARRRQQLTDLAVSQEEQQTYGATALVAQAQYQQAQARLAQAQVNLERTQIRSPVNGWVTNLSARIGDYATAGRSRISIVDADSFWVDGYFRETLLRSIREGDPARVKLMGYEPVLRGRVVSIARGISVANAQPSQQGLATVNPIFTWVRLAQRVPVRVHLDEVPEGVALVAGMTATVQIDPRAARDR